MAGNGGDVELRDGSPGGLDAVARLHRGRESMVLWSSNAVGLENDQADDVRGSGITRLRSVFIASSVRVTTDVAAVWFAFDA
jgi:hypothetical protein